MKKTGWTFLKYDDEGGFWTRRFAKLWSVDIVPQKSGGYLVQIVGEDSAILTDRTLSFSGAKQVAKSLALQLAKSILDEANAL